MIRNILIFASLVLSAQLSMAGMDRGDQVKVACTAIREEPGAPTYGFELRRMGPQAYQARYLNFPGDESLPPEVIGEISDLKCRFLPTKKFYFQCQKLGASVESIEIEERKLSLIENKIQRDLFREFRAVGSDVPGVFLVFRFAKADTCTWK